ncbi:MAG: indolepyruvate ferredoxin oxidoreductase family protein [Candidatus Handelsmanbacteria bacterium]|nr:indolepyruvate ferredoxin oxidoreductase family protein [Candidatus Handelsmanbacteria bacterium]
MELSLEDKFLRREGAVLLTGVEALVRMVLDKQRADAEAGGPVNQTFLSGYEGSPLGGLDLEISQDLELLNRTGRTVHQFGINEKTAASAMLGTQYAAGVDVDAFWYGKAHGVMWVPDEVWLANLAGSRGRGSMVLLCGEDHRSKSSVSPGSSDWALRSSMVPTFYPASVGEILDLGRHAIALSRHLGLVTALKLVTPVCDGAGTVQLRPELPLPLLPEPDGRPYAKRFHEIVMAVGALPMQRELLERKLPLAEEYLRLNRISQIHPGEGEVGLIATGKSYTDLRQALEYLGVHPPVLHLRAIYPLDRQLVRDFAQGLRQVYVVEEPGPYVEESIKAALWGSGVEGVYGKEDKGGRPFLPAWGELDPEVLAQVLAPVLGGSRGRGGALGEVLGRVYPLVPTVTPMSCGGCPYNTFRDLREKPGGEIGCSSIRAIEAYDHGVLYIPTMGAGGSIYSGAAAFNGNKHIFQYLGDGSYFHSGRGAIQTCVQAQVNITFLLLFNGTVALTGGQRPGGWQPMPRVVQELLALGVARVGVVSERADQYRSLNHPQLKVFNLDEHPAALDEFKKVPGTSVLILDKECATEKMRRRRRQDLRPAEYVFIDEELCEGCGDCFRQSEGCAALYPTPTEFGEKTQIRQGGCTQDQLCSDGECPAFVRVRAAGLRRRRPDELGELPEPQKPALGDAYTVYASGRGGTGVVTISHLLAYAAMAEGIQVYLSNNTGLAQKGGPVEAPMVFCQHRQPAFNRLFPGSADLYLGFDLLRAAEPGNLKYAAPGRTLAVVSTTQVPTARMNRHPEEKFPQAEGLQALIDDCTRKEANLYLDSYWLAERLFGDTLYANMLLLGAAYQAGALPLEAASIEAAIRLNGKAVAHNLLAFRWGRLSVCDPGRVQRALAGDPPAPAEQGRPLEGVALVLRDQILRELELDEECGRQFSLRFDELCAYQNLAYAQRYAEVVRQVRKVDGRFADRDLALTQAAVWNLYKLMAYKDEYEVARLATRPEARQRIEKVFEEVGYWSNLLHPPTLRSLFPRKLGFGPWFRPLLRLLVRLRGLRGRALDPFGHTPCRRLERALVGWYCRLVEEVLALVDEGNYALACKVCSLPDRIRGYEEVKMRNAMQVQQEAADLVAQLRAGAAPPV